MVHFLKGDFFQTTAEVLICPVTLNGLMECGKLGYWSDHFPEMREAYFQKCLKGSLCLGRPYLWSGLRAYLSQNDSDERGYGLENPRQTVWTTLRLRTVCICPLRSHTKEAYSFRVLNEIFAWIRDHIPILKAKTFALPQFCDGPQTVDWSGVKGMIQSYFHSLAETHFFVYEFGLSSSVPYEHVAFRDR